MRSWLFYGSAAALALLLSGCGGSQSKYETKQKAYRTVAFGRYR